MVKEYAFFLMGLVILELALLSSLNIVKVVRRMNMICKVRLRTDICRPSGGREKKTHGPFLFYK